MDYPELPVSKLTEFDYLLNRFERASQAATPAEHGYGEHRRALFAYVRGLEAQRATTVSEAVTQKSVQIRGDITPEDFGVPAQYADRASNYAAFLVSTPQPVEVQPLNVAAPSPSWCAEVDAELVATAAVDAVLYEASVQAVRDAVAEAIGPAAYDCTRVWSAWHVGTMDQDDFQLIAEDGNRVAEIADAAIAAMRTPVAAPEAADLFWEIDDGENSSDSIEELIYERDIGELLSIGRAMQLSSIRIRVTADPEDADNRTYEIVSDTTTPAALPVFTQELAAFGALLDGDSLEQGDVA